MAKISFSDQELKFIGEKRQQSIQWESLRQEFNKKFKTNKSPEALRHAFRSYVKGTTFDKPAEAKKPHPLSGFTKEALGNIVKVNDHRQGVFFITAASPTSYTDYSDEELSKAQNDEAFISANVHEAGFKAVRNFCKRERAELIVLPMRAHVKALKSQPQHYDPVLKPFLSNFATEYVFNPHLKAIEAHLNPQQINPLTGLKRLKANPGSLFTKADSEGKVQEEMKRFKTSLIISHSKQMMDVIPTGNDTHPRIIHSTGAITKPAYLRNRIGMIAEEDHVLGGLIVEIDGDRFFIRQVQIDPNDGSFVDLGTRYYADGSVESERAEAFKMGDLHPGFEDQTVLQAWYEIWDIIRPKRVFYEDFFDGNSISHHMAKKNLERQKRPPYFRSLEAELQKAKEVLKETWDRAPEDAELIATASNHPDHVFRYLEEGRYIRDDVNFDIAHRMVVLDLDGKNPLQVYLDPERRMKWLGENDDYFVEGVQMGAHGHLGVNGAKGEKGGQELAYGNAMTAHRHTPGIYHQLFTVGHSSVKRHGYNNGPNTWIPCSGAVYKRGQKQLYMVINGQWRRSPSKKKRKSL